MADLTGKTALITGAASGIGRATALLAASRGARVWLLDRNSDGMQQAIEMAKSGSKNMQAQVMDVSDPDQIQSGIQSILEQENRIDCLVNNAGVNAPGTITELDLQAWDNTQNTNLRSVFLLSKAVWPKMQAQGKGAIVNMSSVMGEVGGSGAPAYCTAKAGILMLTKCLAKDGAGQGIRVNSVCPGFIDTPILVQGRENDPNLAELRQQVEAAQPMRRFGSAREVAKAILFLASDEASFISGASLTVDGALTATQIDG